MTTAQDQPIWTSKAVAFAAGLLAVWGGLAYLIGSTGALYVESATPFRPIALSAIVPVAIFFIVYGVSGRFRAFVLAQNIQALTRLQIWRVVGFSFLLLYAHDVLPAVFAWPAGVGDVLIGLTAPLVVARLAADSAFARSRRFIAFHVLGLLDFVGAIGAAALTSGAFPALTPDGLTSGPMELWPLNLFPSFIVPIFIILHASVFLKLRALSRAANHATAANPTWQAA